MATRTPHRRARPRHLAVVLLLACLGPGCVYKAGSGLAAGILDETAGQGSSGGIEAVGDRLLERQLLRDLGAQLGEGLVDGAGTITPEQRASLEATVEGLLLVAARRTGAGLRDEVSPQLREMVRQDIVNALVEGFRGPVGDSLEETVARTVDTAMITMRGHIEDPTLRIALAELLSESVYLAMREGRPGSPGVGETLQITLSENLLTPFERSVGGITNTVADRVDASARRTEKTLQAIISALVIVLGVFVLMYMLTRRQLTRERESSLEARHSIQSLGAAFELLDDDTRARIRGLLDDPPQRTSERPRRTSDYVRKE